MYHNIFDTHAHYDDERFRRLLADVLECQRDSGVCGIINNGADEASSRRSIEIAKEYDFVYAAVGVHPQEAGKVTDGWLERIEQLAHTDKVVAIGEIGLDYHYPEPDRETQKRVFREQIELANRLGMPIEVHDRDAHADVLSALRELRPSGCLHRFSGSAEMARDVVNIGMYLGFGGSLTYGNSKKEVASVRATPLEYILLETDCPYLAPESMRGRTCTSSLIFLVAERIAAIKGDVTAQQVLDITNENARRLFKIQG